MSTQPGPEFDPKAVVSATPDAAERPEPQESGGAYRFLVFALLPSWLVSMIVHAILIILLALINFSKPGRDLLQVIADKQPELEAVSYTHLTLPTNREV